LNIKVRSDWTLLASSDFDFYMVPGFSTREQASSVSGRGIGMDVVQRAVIDLRGTIDTKSTLGQGASFAMSFLVQVNATQVMISQSARHVARLRREQPAIRP
jgi:chemotaxis protein histidine kinase CheA